MKHKKIFFIAGLITLILNLIWEFSHHTLYIDLSGIPKYTHLIIASFTDMLILLSIFGIVSLKNRTFNWIRSPRKFDYLLITIFGFIIALFIEVINLSLGRWAYTPSMPTIFRIGVSPLIQLSLTGIVSLVILKNVISENNERTAFHRP